MITLLTIQCKKYQAGNFIFSGTNACTNCSESIDNKGNLDFVSESKLKWLYNFLERISSNCQFINLIYPYTMYAFN